MNLKTFWEKDAPLMPKRCFYYVAGGKTRQLKVELKTPKISMRSLCEWKTRLQRVVNKKIFIIFILSS